jgi:spore coat polysaccharide biosynthesis predicted glycosyltransferase SpsG
MNICPTVLIVAEIGKNVGWGHVARAHLLREILSPNMTVTLKVINREPWDDSLLEDEYALRNIVDADIVFLDGLSLDKEVERYVRSPRKISLSYISDVNRYVDYVVAPSLNGMTAPDHFITDLSAMLCNRPSTELLKSISQHTTASDKKLIGVCMGGSDADGVAPSIVASLASRGFETVTYPAQRNHLLSLNDFLYRKLKCQESQVFPYSELKMCRAVICQGGLSAVEFALMGMPTVIRRRTDFSEAYRFLFSKGCALPSIENTIPSMINAIEQITDNYQLHQRMSLAGKSLNASLGKSFWLSLTNRIMGNNYENMPLLSEY